MKNSNLAILVSASLCLGFNSYAEQSSENILVVTADYRDTELQNTATSLSLLSEENLKDSADQHLEEVISQIPNLNWAGGSSRPRYFQIRGIGERSQYEGAPNPSVAMIIDDIDFSGVGMLATLFDVQQIEVLRGPQSARFGANAIAGLINVRSREPNEDAEFNSQLIVADDNTFGLGLSVSGALDKEHGVTGLFSLSQYNNNGFRTNPYLNKDDTNARDEFSLRSKLNWQVNDKWLIKLTAMAADLDNGYDAWALDNSYTTRTDKPGKDSQKTNALASRLEYIGDELDFVFITTYADTDAEHSFDGDWGNDNYWGLNGPYDFTSATFRDRKNNTQEFRLLSKSATVAGEMDWVVGLYRQDLTENNDIEELYNGGIYRRLNSTYDAETLSIFAQGKWLLSDTTNLSLSIRKERRNSEYTDDNPISFSPTDDMVGGDISLQHRLSEQTSTWFSIARGYKAGGFNLDLSVPQENREYQPEYLWNYEAGIRSSFLQSKLRLSASIFHMAREDVQISSSQQLDPSDPLTFIYLTDNAVEGYNRGLELDANWQFDDNWSVATNLGLLDTEVESHLSSDQTLVGREQAHAPSYSASVALQYRNTDGWFGRLEWNAKDAYYYSFSHQQQADSSQQLHFKLGYEEQQWSYYFWARNLTNEEYTVRGFFFANEPPNWQDKLYTRLGDPRHMGVTLRYRY